MKTITLSEGAYNRLLEWKAQPRDSFSAVVLRVVPKKGTFGQLIEDINGMPALSRQQARVMEESVRWGRDVKKERDSWTT